MTAFQVIVITISAALVIASLMAGARGWVSRREGAAWASVWLAVGVTVAWPRVTAIAAKSLGIGRGADLVLYCSVIVMMIGFFMVYARLRALRREITLLVRRLAIQDAMAGASGDAAPGGAE